MNPLETRTLTQCQIVNNFAHGPRIPRSSQLDAQARVALTISKDVSRRYSSISSAGRSRDRWVVIRKWRSASVNRSRAENVMWISF